MVPKLAVCPVDEIFVTVKIDLNIPVRRNQNCTQGIRGVLKNN